MPEHGNRPGGPGPHLENKRPGGPARTWKIEEEQNEGRHTRRAQVRATYPEEASARGPSEGPPKTPPSETKSTERKKNGETRGPCPSLERNQGAPAHTWRNRRAITGQRRRKGPFKAMPRAATRSRKPQGRRRPATKGGRGARTTKASAGSQEEKEAKGGRTANGGPPENANTSRGRAARKKKLQGKLKAPLERWTSETTEWINLEFWHTG
jgi:hypothetical protein